MSYYPKIFSRVSHYKIEIAFHDVRRPGWIGWLANLQGPRLYLSMNHPVIRKCANSYLLIAENHDKIDKE